MSKHVPIALVILLAAVLRFADLGNIQMGIHPDEAMYGYEGLSIAATGTDHRQTGRPPLYLKGQSSHWDNRTSVLYPYLLAGLFSVLPPTMFVERLPAAVASLFVVVFIYLIARELFPARRSLAIVAAALVAVSPLAFFWGRLGHDLVFLPLFTTLVLWLILKTRRNAGWWYAAAAVAGLSLYGYQALKLVVPLMVLLGLWFVWADARRQRRQLLVASVIGLLVALPMIVTQLTHWSEVQGEFSRVNLVTHPSQWWRIPNQLGHLLTGNFLLSFRIVFPFLLPLGMVGGWWLWRRQRRLAILLGSWFVIGIIPALITRLHYEGVDMQWRSLAMLGVLEMLTAGSLIAVVDWLRSSRFFRGLSSMYTGALVAMFVMAVMTLTWLRTGDGQAFCCMNYGGLDRVITRLNEPDLVRRPVVFPLTSYTMPDYVLWMTQYPPAEFQRGPVTWTEFTYPELGIGEHPTAFGRFRFCDPRACYQAGDQALYVVPASTDVPGHILMSLDVIAPQWETSRPWIWHLVDPAAT